VHARRSRAAAAAGAPAQERLRHGRFSFCVAWLKCKVEIAREALADDGRERGRSSPSAVREARCGPCRSVAWFGARGGGQRPFMGDQRMDGDVPRCTRRPREERTAGGMERTGGPFDVRWPDGTWHEERGKTSRRPRWARGLGKGGLGTWAGPDAEARNGARGPGKISVPLFERVKLQKVE
jgi:hypothetical protein